MWEGRNFFVCWVRIFTFIVLSPFTSPITRPFYFLVCLFPFADFSSYSRLSSPPHFPKPYSFFPSSNRSPLLLPSALSVLRSTLCLWYDSQMIHLSFFPPRPFAFDSPYSWPYTVGSCESHPSSVTFVLTAIWYTQVTNVLTLGNPW